MTLTDIVASLELAKQLKEAGYPQESLFEWVNTKGGFTKLISVYSGDEISTEVVYGKIIDRFAAPTATEIGEQLPENVMSFKAPTPSKDWICRFYDYTGTFEFDSYQEIEKTEADARAKMWLYLKSNNLLLGNKQ